MSVTPDSTTAWNMSASIAQSTKFRSYSTLKIKWRWFIQRYSQRFFRTPRGICPRGVMGGPKIPAISENSLRFTPEYQAAHFWRNSRFLSRLQAPPRVFAECDGGRTKYKQSGWLELNVPKTAKPTSDAARWNIFRLKIAQRCRNSHTGRLTERAYGDDFNDAIEDDIVNIFDNMLDDIACHRWLLLSQPLPEVGCAWYRARS